MSAASLPRVCVALSGPAMFATAEKLLERCGFVEFRLDSLAEPMVAVEMLRAFVQEHGAVPVIATCRRRENGGEFGGSAVEEAGVLRAAAAAGAAVVDLSVESAEELAGAAELEALRTSGARLLVSWHDFRGTPDLDGAYERIARCAPEFVKVVPTARSLDDALRLLDLLRRRGGDGRLVAMAMGTAGVLTRVLGPRWGSAWTFAAVDAASATAPGQVGLTTLLDVYRVDSISARTRVFGVFGKPIGSSLSPAMQNAAFRAAGVDAVYLPLETDSAAEVLRVTEALPLDGASVTMPLKEELVPLLAGRLDTVAERMGAANTLVRGADGAMRGWNTDGVGVVEPLRRHMRLEGAEVLVLGAGGAARAAVFALVTAGARVSILNRSKERARGLADASGAIVVSRQEAAARRWDAVVQTTPHGMRGQDVPALLGAEEMNTGVFFDLVYNPRETPLLRAMRACGVVCIEGLEMFVAQGAAQFSLWTGLEAPAAVMRSVVEAALRDAATSR